MAIPTSRDEFKQYCLRKLGAPVIQINVDDDQVDDRVDEALSFYWDFHFDGSEKIYYKHQITATDIANKYITLPENIIGAVRIFSLSDPSIRSDDMFNIRYQIALNDLYTLTNISLVPYYLAMEHLALISEMLVPEALIRYVRHKNKLYIDMDWSIAQEDEYFLVEAYEIIDPELYVDVWKDRWLQNYASAKIKYQWGSNLSKFSTMILPGGIQFNADKIMQDADAEIKELEDDMRNKIALPPLDMYG